MELYDRLYPYVTHLPDISEYGFEDCLEVPDAECPEVKDPDLVNLDRLIFMIRANKFPEPFGKETPAIDLFMKKTISKKKHPKLSEII